MEADTWTQIPDTRMTDVCPEDPDIQGVLGCVGVVSAWGGAALDTRRNRLLVWGGGHADYSGNELYAFDLLEGTWARLTDPSPGPSSQMYSVDPLPDGTPVSRHTYDGLVYLDAEDWLLAHGGSMATSGAGTRVTWKFDPLAGTWLNLQPGGTIAPGEGQAVNLSSAYDPKTGTALMRDPYAVYVYTPRENQWTVLLDEAHTWSAQTSVFEPTRRLFFSIGGGELRVLDVDAAMDVSDAWAAADSNAIVAAEAPGVAYDPVGDMLVAWSGGPARSLDLSTQTWEEGSAQGAPASAQPAGTFGRWRYVPILNAFVLVRAADEDVWIYKRTAGCAP